MIGFTAVAAEAAQPRTAIPQVIAGALGAPYTWISSESLIDDSGNLKTTKLGPTAMRALENYLKTKATRAEGRNVSPSALMNVDPCGGVSMAFPAMEEYRPMATLEDLVGESSDIFAGDVVGVSQETFQGTPASLLRIRIQRALRDSGGVMRTAGTVLLAYPYATLHVHEHTYCTRAFNLEGALPPVAVGDRIILFNYSSALGAGHSVIEVDAAHQLIVEHAGALTIPTEVKSALTGSNFDNVLTQLSVRLKKTPMAGRQLAPG